MLDGVVGATITTNTISNNNSGGIGLADNGPVDPGTPNAGPGTAVPSTGNTISGNTLTGNTGGCGIIVEAWDPGGGVDDHDGPEQHRHRNGRASSAPTGPTSARSSSPMTHPARVSPTRPSTATP